MKLFYGEIFPEIRIYSEEQQHLLKVLRMKDGEVIQLTDGWGNLATGTLRVEGKKAALEPLNVETGLADFSRRLHVALAPTKNIDRTEFFVEKATELGVSEITFLLTEQSERKAVNLERIQKQIVSASKQSGRFHFPRLNPMVKLADFVASALPESTFVAHCDTAFERVGLEAVPALEAMTFLIGPEGDFSPREIEMLTNRGIRAVQLGNQRLRTETAGVFVAAWNYYRMMALSL